VATRAPSRPTPRTTPRSERGHASFEETAIERVLLDTHNVAGFVAVVANGVAGIVCLIAWRVHRWRGRWVWILTIVAETLFLFDIVVGTVLFAAYDYDDLPRIHMFYGFLVFLTVGLAFQYRDAMRGRTELLYGLVGLFLMGLGIRAVFNVTG
jgi:hypothetical protein